MDAATASLTPPSAGVRRNAGVEFDADTALLVDLLKIATFIGGPMRAEVAEPLGITATDLRIVLALGGEGELAGHDLSAIMGVPPMNVSRALAGLLERGLIEPGSDTANRRRKPVRLSAAGEDLFRRTVPAMSRVGARLFGPLRAADRAAFTRAAVSLLERLREDG